MAAVIPSPQSAGSAPLHSFRAVAFVENFNLKELARSYPEGQRTSHEIHVNLAPQGDLFIYPFGAVTFHDVAPDRQEVELVRLREARSGLTSANTIAEDFSVEQQANGGPTISGGILKVDRLTPERTSVVALTVAQSASMEYYEKIVDQMFTGTGKLVEGLERKGTVSPWTRPLARFIGATIGTRSEVLAVLHLLDKPEATWEDPAMDRIYAGLRAEFDLEDRYRALEMKLRSVQEALELVVDVARDRKLLLLEGTVIFLIALEIVLGALHFK